MLKMMKFDGKYANSNVRQPFYFLNTILIPGIIPPEVLLYLTDGFGPAPKNRPNYPVIWGVIEDGTQPAEWGQMMEISRGS